jgi:hypothetical protein
MSLTKVKYNSSNVYICGAHKVLPGINLIDSKVWSEMEKHPTIAARVKSGVFDVLKKGKNVSISPEDVKNVFDVFQLDSWVNGDDQEMADAAKKQLEKIEATAQKKD